jgi:hypothetical protein
MTVAWLGFIGKLLLYRQPAGDGVEFEPPFEGEAIEQLLMVKTGAGSATCPAPDLYRYRLPSGPRRNLPGETIQMPQGLAPCADCLRQRL